MSSISVIIPTLNESGTIQNCLNQPALRDFDQVIVADASHPPLSNSDIPNNTILVTSQKGRALQMNSAANLATSEILLFLHADTTLPENAYTSIITAIESGNTAGCFKRQFTPPNQLLNFTSKLANSRAKHLFWAYGDQAIFITRSAFQQIQGYPLQPTFEDLELCIRSKKVGSHAFVETPIQTSSRRFNQGTTKVLLSDFAKTLHYLLTRKRPT